MRSRSGSGPDLTRAQPSRELDAGQIRPQPVELLTRLLFTTLGEAGMSVAEAQDQDAARAEAKALMLALLQGLRAT